MQIGNKRRVREDKVFPLSVFDFLVCIGDNMVGVEMNVWHCISPRFIAKVINGRLDPMKTINTGLFPFSVCSIGFLVKVWRHL